jgi:hypothetical protein
VARFTSKKRELMRAVLRLGIAISAAGLALGSAPALAQDAAESATNAPANEVVGPRELQNFSLDGTVTRPADPVPVPRAATPSRRPPTAQAPTIADSSPRQNAAAAPRKGVDPAPVQTAQRTTAATPAPPVIAPAPRPGRSVTVSLPPPDASPVATGFDSAAPGFAPEPETMGEGHRLLLWPWLLAALALAGAGAFLFWRNRSREALAGAAGFDAFVAPEAVAPPRPAPAPVPAPAPPKPSTPMGIVSTRLRPWIDLIFSPVRFVIDNDVVTIEFELGVQNSGNAPARGVLVEASLFNAGQDQERDLRAFFEAPVAKGERIAAIPPLKTVAVRTKVTVPRSSVQVFDVGGRQVIVPLIAFNALYGWSGGDGQTSHSYLLGRDSKGEKMAPFRLDLGPRVFRGIAARQLPAAVRN